MTNSQESEGGLSFSTTSYTYELDFVQDDFNLRTAWLSKFIYILKATIAFSKGTVVTSAKVSWQSLLFTCFYLIFIQKRLVSFVYFLEEIKDGLVKLLMWRRGLLFRPTVHGGLLIITSSALLIGSLFTRGVAPQDFSRDQVLAAANTPETIIPEGRPRSEIIQYKVKEGDTLSAVASVYNINVDSIKWANDITKDESIQPGDVLSVPPVSGVVHKVKEGDTLDALGAKYESNAQTIADYPFNYIDDSLQLRVGQMLIIPDGKMPPPKPLPQYAPTSRPAINYVAGGSGMFSWPVAGSLNQGASWWHPAIDIGAPYGSPVGAADGGTVTYATFSGNGFGNFVIIDHGNGYTTTYAHLGSIGVHAGQVVGRGQYIGSVGCTGFCTGPHLHFEVRRAGSFVNPLSVLP